MMRLVIAVVRWLRKRLKRKELAGAARQGKPLRLAALPTSQ
jgi:hypothetical protein